MLLCTYCFVPGGHNLLILAHDLGKYVQLGTTIDDAIGEAYDKTARWLGLEMGRGGGPALEELALEGDAHSIKFSVSSSQQLELLNFIMLLIAICRYNYLPSDYIFPATDHITSAILSCILN